MLADRYVHGYRPREQERLRDQADALVELLHSDTHYPSGSTVLEVGCGVGAQTITLARQSPEAIFTSIDISADSLREAERKVNEVGLRNVDFREADIFALPFAAESFGHIFVCFVLEHLAEPLRALRILKEILKPGGTITVIEGDHGSTYFYPRNSAAEAAINALVKLQSANGGNALIGRELYPLLTAANFGDVRVSPRMVYVDASRPELVDSFTRKTFIAMIEGVRPSVLEHNILAPAHFDAGVKALYRTAEPDGVFCYTFFKAVGKRL